MSTPPPHSSPRGCASNFALPLTEEETLAAQSLVDNVYYVNCRDREINPHLAEIVYRSSGDNRDITDPVFRWDTRPYEEIFEHGFQSGPEPDNSSGYNLYDFVQNAGAPLGSHRPRRYAFVSTTVNRRWRPTPGIDTLPGGGEMQVYCYEIFAPGGIWINYTLEDRYTHPSQAEVCFVGGIAPHYIRSAQLFTLARPSYDPATQRPPFPSLRRANNILTINPNFHLFPDEDIQIRNPVFRYWEGDVIRPLCLETYTPRPRRQKRQVSSDKWDAAFKWYTGGVAEVPSYIDAAFRAYSTNEAYLFMKNEYVLLNYAPGTTDDKIVNGPPLLICDGFPSLIDTPFGELGIDCAFDTDSTNAFIFYANLCAYIDYAPGTTDDKILSGPMTITAMFPFFKGTVFEDRIDAAFRATSSKEAYLFRGGQYALINYDSKHLIHVEYIRNGFPSLVGTVFESGIEASFASHREDEAYIFKGEYYALINFAPGTTDDYIIGSRVKRILDHWPSLRRILPRKNYGLDIHDHNDENHSQYQNQHDEF